MNVLRVDQALKLLRVLACGATVAALVSCAGSQPRSPTSPAPVPQPTTFTMPERAVCERTIGNPVELAALGDDALAEASGIVVSLSRPGVLWLHNDEDPRVFAVSAADGRALGSVTLEGVPPSDFEDLAAAPCPDLTLPCLYLADTGNNAFDREELFVHAFAEPDVAVDRPLPEGATVAAAQIWTFPIATGGDPTNIEALVVTPDATAMLFFEKNREEARVFRYSAPWTPGERAVLETTARIEPPGDDGPSRLITGASIHANGRLLLLRTYVAVFEARFVDEGGIFALPGGRGFERVARDDFTLLYEPPDEPQGEAIAYDERGDGIWTVSEARDNPGQPLHHASCPP